MMLLLAAAAHAADPTDWEGTTLTAALLVQVPECVSFTAGDYSGTGCTYAVGANLAGVHRLGKLLVLEWSGGAASTTSTDTEFVHTVVGSSDPIAFSAVGAGVDVGIGVAGRTGKSEVRATIGPSLGLDLVSQDTIDAFEALDVSVDPESRVTVGGRFVLAWDAQLTPGLRLGPRVRVELSQAVAETWSEDLSGSPDALAAEQDYYATRVTLSVAPAIALDLGKTLAFHAEVSTPTFRRASTGDDAYAQLVDEGFEVDQVDTTFSWMPRVQLGLRLAL